MKRVTVYCASSPKTHADYLNAATRLGEILGDAGWTTVYGGGGIGSMGALADGALSRGGRVEGVLPRFMYDLEWGHTGLTDLHLVNDLHERKRLMIDRADAVVALPGGCGTFEELFEAITWKRLGLFAKPIIIVNIRNYYDPCLKLLEQAVREHFMNEKHLEMWSVAAGADEVLDKIEQAPAWSEDDRRFAAVK
ncbi:TIGR00730 family Rossman fold protein [Marinicaulis aureus]|uniref:Cytokinin riboside 5'-monophosphate phosphoribohydrolase n=1 Tax=Hyphococcus aureus TaxID=2666033 RepID=A0ABW1KUR3_9PROT